ncbi:Two-component sensor histidine kinase, contains HisKA and HATPase domains [Poseidonocella pacifica]|uniref:histidine kinase n=1 Tax=Poseidonocella pacifica TaxID=871651 RepID=A0A1I0YI61_9RHOB|nr:HWE histidine kinase domain-containing protein [Poseidonocella pacifica]SFB13059.1 Two-component sensor histidine kinase, contains HisKA and HATPase domains [Poseidonocella pacifica]
MLRRQNPNLDPMSFLSGPSEMAQRIREFDWTGHPFGPPETWPQSLRSALAIALNSTFPTAIYWGSDLRLLYNDAWSSIPGPRHPGCLGERAEDVWYDIWHVIEPQFTELIVSGTGIFLEDQLLPMKRYRFEEETYWTYNFSPIRGEDGAIEGVFNSGMETTAKVLEGRQSSFLLGLSDSLRGATGTDDLGMIVCGALGKYLGAIRVGIREVQRAKSPGYRTLAEWTATDIDPVGDQFAMENIGPVALPLAAGKVGQIIDTSEVSEPTTREAFHSAGTGSLLAVPWMKDHRLEASLFIHRANAGRWSDADIALTEQVLERFLHEIEQQRSLEREQIMASEIDHRARNLLGVVRALVNQNSADDVPSYKAKLLDRLAGLSNTHSLLAGNRWSVVSLDDVLRNELSPYLSSDTPQATLEGPAVELSPDMAQAIAMVVHELATNAMKYGALTGVTGKLDVAWEVSHDEILRIKWQERTVDAGRTLRELDSSGFGTNLLVQIIERQLGGEFSRGLDTDGFKCEIVIDLRRDAGIPEEREVPNCPENGQGRTRIFIVEDDPIISMDLVDTVEAMGYEVVGTAGSVKAGLSQLAKVTPDLAVVDINLGKETSEAIAKHLVLRGIPFLQLTGYEFDATAGSVFDGRPRLMKPISEDSLAEELRKL